MHSLKGTRVLIVRDAYFIADDLAEFLARRGATVLGPVPIIDRAFQFVEQADAAVLDVKPGEAEVFPLADRLIERKVPLVFLTDYEHEAIPSRLSHIRSLRKTAPGQRIVQVLFPKTGSDDEADDIVALLPKLRLAARLIMPDETAADRLVEAALREAVRSIDSRPHGCPAETWLNDLLRRAAAKYARFLH